MNVWTVDDVIQYWSGGGAELTADDIEAAASRLGRDHYPALIDSLVAYGWLTTSAAAVVVASAWSAAEHPQDALHEDEWRYLFEFAGYTVDGVPAPRPTAPVQVYRGADEAHRLGWSWTDDRKLAAWFARRWSAGQVWTLFAPPYRLLARISDQRPGESEFVVDTTGLDPTAAMST
jgi:hypothetical protein